MECKEDDGGKVILGFSLRMLTSTEVDPTKQRL